MIYLSAQPDEIYFLWQLEILILNFKKIGIKDSEIHILIGYDVEIGISKEASIFYQNNKSFANIFFYSDQRISKHYLSSIRPNIIKQHWNKNPSLENESIFYHDSDIILREKIKEEHFKGSLKCYVSDTRSYLGYNIIEQDAGNDLLKKMVNVVGIDELTVKKNNNNVGGAQYLLKKINFSFWEKLEKDSENLFSLIESFNKQKWICNFEEKRIPYSKSEKLDPWLADMWAILWNLWRINREVVIDKKLDFAWADSPIAEYNEKIILHYTGSDNYKDESVFLKGKYKNYFPWYENLSKVSQSNCSYLVVQSINEKYDIIQKDRFNLQKLNIILSFSKWNSTFVELFLIQQKYLLKYFIFNKLLLFDETKKIFYDLSDKFQFIEDFNKSLLLKNIYIDNNKNKNLFFPINCILEKDAIIEIVTNYKESKHMKVYEIHNVYSLDLLFFEKFKNVVDDKLFIFNRNKFVVMKEKKEVKIVIGSNYCDIINLKNDFKVYDISPEIM